MTNEADNEKLEVLLGACLDARSALVNVEVDADNEALYNLCEVVSEHLVNLSCVETLEDATANMKRIFDAIEAAPIKVRRELREVKDLLVDGQKEIAS